MLEKEINDVHIVGVRKGEEHFYLLFRDKTLSLINHAEQIVNEYSEMGYVLTLRQLYYQFVARDILPNNYRSYKNLGETINNARLSGLISWEAIVDRTRNLQSFETFDSVKQMIESMVDDYNRSLWDNIPIYVEVWVEKDALIDVVSKACSEYQINHFSTRGYCSSTEVWNASQRFKHYTEIGHQVQIIHLSDHDPSGIDMTKDLNLRLRSVFSVPVRVRRLALTMEQIEQYQPPPNPVKQTDSRCPDYQQKYGDESWELDALPPNVISDLIKDKIEFTLGEANIKKIKKTKLLIEEERKQLVSLVDNFASVTNHLKRIPKRKK